MGVSTQSGRRPPAWNITELQLLGSRRAGKLLLDLSREIELASGIPPFGLYSCPISFGKSHYLGSMCSRMSLYDKAI
jgi:hypothetical protein